MAQNGIPLVAKKWANQENDPNISREWRNYAYTVNFIEIKLDNRRPSYDQKGAP